MSVQLEGLAGRTADSFVHSPDLRPLAGRVRASWAPVGTERSGFQRPRAATANGAKKARNPLLERVSA
jgi:hypothetical protein